MRLSLPTIAHRLRPERPQLAVLVALLMVSFALTVGLAWQAWDAGRGEEAVSEEMLDHLLYSTAEDWRLAADFAFGTSIQQTFARVAPLLETNPETLSVDLVARSLATKMLPPESGMLDQGSVFYCGPGEAADPRECPPELAAWLRRLNVDARFALLAGSVVAGVHASGPESTGAVAFAAKLPQAGGEAFVAGYRLSEAFVAYVLAETVMMAWERSSSLPRDIPPGELYAFTARRAGGQAIVEDTTPVFRGRIAVDTATTMLHGVSFSVGLKPAGVEHYLANANFGSRVPALAALLLSITVLIGVSVFLMRREAELHWMRARFVSGVSHELRTPLAQIRMFAETLMLGRVRSEADRRRSLEIIDQEARRLSHLVENILTFSRAEGGGVRITPEATRISAELAAMVQDFMALPKARQSRFRLELQENVVVPVDVGALRQIVNNLLDNAVKYGPEGQRVTVGLALFDGTARLWVDDEGPGIPAIDRMNVFQSFYRLRRDEESRIAGSGIGLAVVRELTALHGGEVWAEEAPGGGARLVVAFPEAELTAALPASAAVA